MKKVAIVVIVVAVIAAGVLGGIAMAGGGPGRDAGKIYMETFWGSGQISEGMSVILDEDYPEVAHVSVTMSVGGIDEVGDVVYIWVWFPPFLLGDDLAKVTVNGTTAAYEFDASHWSIGAYDYGGDRVEVHYNATRTYPR